MPFLKGNQVNLGRIPWNKGKTFGPNPEHSKRMKGRIVSEETSLKISLAKKNKPVPKLLGNTNGFKKGMKPKHFFLKGNIPWNKGKGKNTNRRNFDLLSWKRTRKEVYERDGWRCKECGKGNCKLNAHHIDYVTTNNDLSNLITLCISCHMKTNFKRNDWTNYFRRK